MRQVLSTRNARISGCFRILAISLLAADDDAALAGADQLVGAEQDHVRAGLDGFADGRLMRQAELLQVQQRARAEIVNQQQIAWLCASSASSRSGTSLVKPTTR